MLGGRLYYCTLKTALVLLILLSTAQWSYAADGDLDGKDDVLDRPKRVGGPDGELVDPTAEASAVLIKYDPLTGETRPIFDTKKCESVLLNCPQYSEDAKKELAKGDAEAPNKTQYMEKCFAACSAEKAKYCSDEKDRKKIRLYYFACNKLTDAPNDHASEKRVSDAKKDEAAENALGADQHVKYTGPEDEKRLGPNFPFQDPQKGRSTCYSYFGEYSTEVNCVAHNTGEKFTTSPSQMGQDADYIREIQRPASIPVNEIPIPRLKPSCEALGTCRFSDLTGGGVNEGSGMAGGADAGAPPGRDSGGPADSTPAVSKDETTNSGDTGGPQPEKQALKPTTAQPGGTNSSPTPSSMPGGLNGGSSSGGNTIGGGGFLATPFPSEKQNSSSNFAGNSEVTSGNNGGSGDFGGNFAANSAGFGGRIKANSSDRNNSDSPIASAVNNNGLQPSGNLLPASAAKIDRSGVRVASVDRSKALLPGAKYYNRKGSVAPAGTNGRPLLDKNGKPVKTSKSKLKECKGNVQCLLALAGMSGKKFKTKKARDRYLASFMEKNKPSSLPREIGRGQHDVMSQVINSYDRIQLDFDGFIDNESL